MTLWIGLALQGCYDPDLRFVDPVPPRSPDTEPADIDRFSGNDGSGGLDLGSGGGGVSVDPEPPTPGDVVPSLERPELQTSRLPAPCRNVPYRGKLDAYAGAGGPYTWKVLSEVPPGLTVSDDGEVAGTLTAEAVLTVQVTDGAGTASLPVDVNLSWRQSCWLAYISAEDGDNRLHFRDVFLVNDVELPAAAAAGEGVSDFAFSPDGAWLAYRVRSGSQYRLEVYATSLDPESGLAAQGISVAFPCAEGPSCSVIDYLWSDDSQRIAVILGGQSDAQDYVSGVDVSSLAAPWLAIGEGDADGETVALDYGGRLVWGGSDWFALLGASRIPGEEGLLTLYTATPGRAGAPVGGLRVTTSVVLETPALRAVPGGVILTTTSSEDQVFFSRGADPLSTRADTFALLRGRLSPSGRLIGYANPDARLQLSDPNNRDALPSESDRGTCERIVAWSTRNAGGRERIACSAGDDLNVFDYLDSTAQATLTPSRTILLETPLARARRAFTDSGNWLVIEDPEDGFSAVDLSAERPYLEWLYGPSLAEMELATGRDAVTFSGPRYLTEVRLNPPTEVREYRNYGGSTATMALCDEQGQDLWCGAPHVRNHIAYAVDSQSLLFEAPSPTLWLADLSVYVPTAPVQLTTLAPPCSLDCKGSVYAFAP